MRRVVESTGLNTALTAITLGVAGWALLTLIRLEATASTLKSQVEHSLEDHQRYETNFKNLDDRCRRLEVKFDGEWDVLPVPPPPKREGPKG